MPTARRPRMIGAPTPMGMYDPGSGRPRFDLWFRDVIGNLEGYKDMQLGREMAEQKMGLAEREQARREEATGTDIRYKEALIEKYAQEPKYKEVALAKVLNEHFPDYSEGQWLKHIIKAYTPEERAQMEKDLMTHQANLNKQLATVKSPKWVASGLREYDADIKRYQAYLKPEYIAADKDPRASEKIENLREAKELLIMLDTQIQSGDTREGVIRMAHTLRTRRDDIANYGIDAVLGTGAGDLAGVEVVSPARAMKLFEAYGVNPADIEVDDNGIFKIGNRTYKFSRMPK